MHKVTISSTGEEFSLPHNAHLSDAAELQLAGLIFGCRAGACGICAIEVVAGGGNLSVPEDSETDFLSFLGYEQRPVRLACQCKLQGDVTIRQL
ncbi:2Fe-2S iron-sulfur cluster-binding protein [Andreprevotia chitinilytica]|uniref:2Fe-2S iron-sulfur cluster-binding protein n=1 Tax=Andreprevotia chitinilytica TaxID=396808 RepID=UPI0005574A5B|nr:2Fe-2S iron-sulfur cluster-binding protein [Andreprevotia chitinilytica]